MWDFLTELLKNPTPGRLAILVFIGVVAGLVFMGLGVVTVIKLYRLVMSEFLGLVKASLAEHTKEESGWRTDIASRIEAVAKRFGDRIEGVAQRVDSLAEKLDSLDDKVEELVRDERRRKELEELEARLRRGS